MKIFLTFLFGLMTLISQAQETTKLQASELPFFIDIDAGFLLVPDYTPDTYLHYSTAAGYRFNERHAIGAEYRSSLFHENYYADSGTGAGLCYRFTIKGIFLKLSAGKQLTGEKEAYEDIRKYDYERGGHYQNITLGYHFRNGLLIAFTSTAFRNIDYKVSKFEFADDYDGDQDFFWNVRDLPSNAGIFLSEENLKDKFWAGTITFGYSFPGRYRNGR